ncbi:unnamed protein product [Allacma fusca]|uniref:Ionotropic glutamate receptor L-glutamate and glycine-binding domain-containing protein n=1 Tax=Allacma fusca TaxID=39272 RepID=A0A8J2JPT7_9HEXA|nr:unnamed protein product [Allacma fusca]
MLKITLSFKIQVFQPKTPETFFTSRIINLKYFSGCTLLHVPQNFESKVLDHSEILGIASILLLSNLSNLKSKLDVLRIKKYSSLCTVAIVDVYKDVSKRIEEVTQLLTNPIYTPLTLPNQDYYIFRTQKGNHMDEILQHPLISFKFSFKLVLASGSASQNVIVKSLCLLCNPRHPSLIDLSNEIISASDASLHRILFPDFQHNFKGKLLRASLFTRPSSTIHVQKVNGLYVPLKTGGVGLRTFITLAEKLNFTYSFIPETAMGIRQKNGTWNGIIGDVLHGRADFGLTNAVVLSRLLVVDFAHPFAYLHLGFVHGPALKIYSWESIFWPFNPQMWMWIIGSSIAVIAFLHTFFYCTRKAGLERDLDNWSSPSIFGFVGASFVTQITEEPKGLPMQWFTLSWYQFIIIITTLYLSRMFELYVEPPTESVPEDFSELAKSDYGISMTYFGGAVQDFFQNSADGSSHKNISYRMKKQTVLGCHQDAQIPKCACIAFDLVAETVIRARLGDKHGRSNLTLRRTADFGFPFAFSIPKRWIFKETVNRVVGSLFECGFELNWKFQTFKELRRDRFMKEAAANNNPSGEGDRDEAEEDLSLTMKHLTGAFSILQAGLSLCLVNFVLEVCQLIFWRGVKNKHSIEPNLPISSITIAKRETTATSSINTDEFKASSTESAKNPTTLTLNVENMLSESDCKLTYPPVGIDSGQQV